MQAGDLVLPRWSVARGEPVRLELPREAAARLAVAEGNLPMARKYVDYALGQGYFAPDFINFCKRYDLCELQ